MGRSTSSTTTKLIRFNSYWTKQVQNHYQTRLDSRWIRCRQWESHGLFSAPSAGFIPFSPHSSVSGKFWSSLKLQPITELLGMFWKQRRQKRPANITHDAPLISCVWRGATEAHRLCEGVWCVGEQTEHPKASRWYLPPLCIRLYSSFGSKRVSRDSRDRLKLKRVNHRSYRSAQDTFLWADQRKCVYGFTYSFTDQTLTRAQFTRRETCRNLRSRSLSPPKEKEKEKQTVYQLKETNKKTIYVKIKMMIKKRISLKMCA